MTGLTISATGMTNAAQRQAVVANNIANLITPEFRAARADSVELRGGGAAVGSITRDAGPGAPLASGVEGSNVNLARELTETVLNRNAFQANANAFRAQADLVGELLDLIG